MKYILFVLSFSMAPFFQEALDSNSIDKHPVSTQIDWKSFADLNTKGNKNKKVMIFIYTDWCKWCRELDQTSFSDPELSSFVNKNYFPIKFNGEKDESIEFKGQTYKLKKEDEKVFHQFTEQFNKGDIAYPAIVFLDEDLKVIQTVKGFRRKDEMFNVLRYFEGNFYRKVSWTNYINSLDN